MGSHNLEDILADPMAAWSQGVRNALEDKAHPGLSAKAIVMTSPMGRPRPSPGSLKPNYEYTFYAMVPRIHGKLLKEPGSITYATGIPQREAANNYHHQLTRFTIVGDLPRPSPGDLIDVKLHAYGHDRGFSDSILNLEDGEYVGMDTPQYAPEWVPNTPETMHQAGTKLADLDWTQAVKSPVGLNEDPGTFSWSNGKAQYKVIWTETGQELKNGQIEDSGLLVTDTIAWRREVATQEGHSVAFGQPFDIDPKAITGATLIRPAMDDWLKLNAAFRAVFDEPLKSSGYRTYDGQVHQRMKRAEGDVNCPGVAYPCKGGTCYNKGNGEGSGVLDINCKVLLTAATPGTSNHGWGAAADIRRRSIRAWKKTWNSETGKYEQIGAYNKSGTANPFRWLNKFSRENNFIFGAYGEHWHLDWTKFTEKITDSTKRVGKPKEWTKEGSGLSGDVAGGKYADGTEIVAAVTPASWTGRRL